MYGYEPDYNIGLEEILQKITQKQIFEFVFEIPIDYGRHYKSPFRADKNAGCRFEARNGTWLFVDFGEARRKGNTHRSCFNAVMDMHDVTMKGAIRLIVEKFRLSTDRQDYKPVHQEDSFFSETSESGDPTIIRYDKKEIPSRTDIGFWTQFLIKMEHLTEDNVFCAKSFSLKNERKGYRIINPYKYCYVMDFNPRRKIYQPFSEKFKWISSCNENDVGNVDNLPWVGDELIVQKAYKDHRIIRNVLEGSNVVWNQSEGSTPDDFILKNWTDRFKLITIFYDNDEAGIMAALRLKVKLETFREGCSRVVCMPYRTEVKDLGEFTPKNRRQDVLELLKYILYG